MSNQQTLQVGTGSVTVEVVSTPSAMAKGLSGRASLAADRGMLFLYEQRDQPTFWMKGMKFPIDIIWLDKGQVIGIESNVPADNGAIHYPAPAPIDAVLELTAGAAEVFGLKVGDRIEYES